MDRIVSSISWLMLAWFCYSLTVCQRQDRPFSSKGYLIGLAPIPELTDRKKSRKLESKGAHVMEQKKTKKRTAPPRYDDAFKAGAVRLVTEQGRQPVEVAKELGICIDTLRSWLKASGIQMGQVSRQNREQKRIRELEAENRSLRRQLGEKDEVIDVLKKSVGILSKP